MPFEVQQLGDEPIIIVTLIKPLDVSTEPALVLKLANEIARKFPGPVYRITNVIPLNPSFEILVGGLADDIRHSAPNIRHIIVGTGDIVEFGAQAQKQQQYGAQEAHMFASVEEAIAFARQQLKS